MNEPLQVPEDPLQERARLYLKQKSIPTQIQTLVADSVTKFLRDEPVVLTRNEKRRLYRTVMRDMFAEIVAGLDDPKA